MENKINIEKYFNKGTFVVPEYQRGYKWSVKDGDKESSLEFFLTSLIIAFENNLSEYFIEAVTVVEDNKQIILVDGQQRTTSLFLIFKELGEIDLLKDKLVYNIREDSHKWLSNQISEIEDEDVQDIYYFKEAIKQIESKKEQIKSGEERNKKSFLSFVKENVFLLYNSIPKEKAVNTFIALNGLKAIMKDEELIKSDLLIKSSRIEIEEGQYDKNQPSEIKSEDDVKKWIEIQKEQFAIEWKVNEDRGRLSRNWDKWLYWWNQDEVKNYFGTGNNHPLYYLLVTYWNINNVADEKIKEFSFDNFKSQFIDNAKNAKLHFEGLRKLQKTFEDMYYSWEIYNLLGLALNTAIFKNDVLEFFIQNREKKEKLKRFTKWSLAGCTIKEISDDTEHKYIEKRDALKSTLYDKELYNSDAKNQAYLQLLRMNVSDMNTRKFDFDVFKTKSLEHICPQKPNELDTDFINSKNDIDEKSDSINSIGNLVLLNGSANSSLSNRPLDIKKQKLFEKIKDGFLLPHTLKVFSKSFTTNTKESETEKLFDNEKYWLSQNVDDNKAYFFNEFDKYYGE
ncbi:uncharacterized protein with ParB-like and HNH nuclease domain [Pedobacter sp. UYP30]|uniref:DUF262 domain-containing protein n=1 Tax=Pedobacter sp. UYP30 TaxID=1756400 RepID=UPI0033908B8C